MGERDRRLHDLRYLELSIRCQRGASEAVEQMLTEVIGTGYAVDDPQAILDHQQNGTWDITDLVAGDPEWLIIRSWLPEVGDVEQTRLLLEQALSEIVSRAIGAVESPVYKWVQEEDWANAWREYFKPLRIGERLVVIPSWEEYHLQAGDLPLYLDPGMAFGTGTHATTSLCLAALERLIKPGNRVLDVGTGSGILAIAAHRLGASEVTAIDIDPVAVQVASENVVKNGVGVDVARSTVSEVQGEGYDLVIANIIATVIIDLLPTMVGKLKLGGQILVSGIIDDKHQQVLDAMNETWLLPVEVRQESGWVAITAKKF
jgi:ribosomal protein L11 methyltransferase